MKINPIMIISFGMVALTLGILVVAQLLGYMPDEQKERLRSRLQLAETIAIQLSLLAKKPEIEMMETLIDEVIERNPQIKSIALRLDNGDMLASSELHPATVMSPVSTADFIQMPLYKNDLVWGQVEVAFFPIEINSLMAMSFLRLLLFVGLCGFVIYFLLMRKVLRNLDPYSVIPARVVSVMNAMSDGVCLIDEHDNIVLVNDTFSSMTGIDAVSLKRLKLASLNWCTAEQQVNTAAQCPWLEALSKRTTYNNKIIRYSKLDETMLVLSSNATVLTDTNNKPRGALVTFDDITELEHKKAILQRQREAEKKRIRWLENMAGILKHEMRIALDGAASSVILLEDSPRMDEEDKGLLGLANNSHRIIKDLVETMCDATSLESSFLKEVTEPIRLDLLMEDYTKNYKYIYPDNVIDYHTDGSEITVQCQEERIIQMIDKLISNAIDYTPAEKPITVKCEKLNKTVTISVANEGEPLPDDKEVIFELFATRRGNNIGENNQGIGLYVVRLIAEGYGGHVEAFNRQDVRGSEFVITLPLAE